MFWSLYISQRSGCIDMSCLCHVIMKRVVQAEIRCLWLWSACIGVSAPRLPVVPFDPYDHHDHQPNNRHEVKFERAWYIHIATRSPVMKSHIASLFPPLHSFPIPLIAHQVAGDLPQPLLDCPEIPQYFIQNAQSFNLLGGAGSGSSSNDQTGRFPRSYSCQSTSLCDSP